MCHPLQDRFLPAITFGMLIIVVVGYRGASDKMSRTAGVDGMFDTRYSQRFRPCVGLGVRCPDPRYVTLEACCRKVVPYLVICMESIFQYANPTVLVV